MNALAKPIADRDIEAAAVKSFEADAATVVRYMDKAALDSPDRVEWFALSIRHGDEWSIVGRRRTKVELSILARRGPLRV